MSTILPGMIDRWRGKRNGQKRCVGQVLKFDGSKKKEVICEVYGDSLLEMRRRKYAAWKALLKTEDNP